MCLPGPEITDVLIRPGHRWVSGIMSDPNRAVRNRLCMWSLDDPTVVIELLDDPMPNAGRGLSGGVHAWNCDGTVVVVTTRADGLIAIAVDGDRVASVRRLGLSPNRSWSTPSFDAAGTVISSVADWNEVWACPLGDGEPWLVYTADHMVVDSTAGPGGHWVTWDVPHVPWTQSRVHPLEERADLACQQPRRSLHGTSFGWIDDSTGTNNIHIAADHIVDHVTVIDDECEHGGPTWGPGQRTWCFNPDGSLIAYTRNERGFSTLWVLDRRTGARHQIGRGVHGCLSWDRDTLVALRSGARTPQQVVAYDVSNLDSPERTILVRPYDGEWTTTFDAEMVEPVIASVDSDGWEIHYRLYSPATSTKGLIVWVHGGPNDQWQVTHRPRLVYWLSRGWSIAVVDHRGTTGHGRAFTQALNGAWGHADALDTIAVTRALHQSGDFSPRHTVFMGSSAGGLTILNAAAMAPGLVAGIVAAYPVVDLGELMGGDDPFETPHVPTLVGSDDPGSNLVTDRSPVVRAAALAVTPILVIHGDSDHSVPLVHSKRLLEAVRDAGGDITLVVMEGEGHGFKEPATIEREYTVTSEFLSGL
jgi:dipeptidyl aminopeptidase/acylaminoacyl peptidase